VVASGADRPGEKMVWNNVCGGSALRISVGIMMPGNCWHAQQGWWEYGK
jgi:hypothetical protein